jgi:murein peptide amidase A
LRSERLIGEERSAQGREIEAFVFGSGDRTAMVMSAVHGDEPSGVRVVEALLARLESMPEGSPGGTRLVVMPRANPDGLEAGTRQNANGVDLNRNFPSEAFGTGEKSGNYYGGESAASEPETRVIMKLIEDCSPFLIISLHAALACVNYNGPSLEVAEKLSAATGLPVTDDVGYPCPGSMGQYYGHERKMPLITLELPKEEIDSGEYARILLEIIWNS